MQGQPNTKAGASDIKRAFAVLSIVCALMLTFVLTPLLYAVSIDAVQGFTARNYQPGFEDLVSVAWFSTAGIAIFAALWAGISVLLTMLTIRLATRFL